MGQLFPRGLGIHRLMKIPAVFAVRCRDSCLPMSGPGETGVLHTGCAWCAPGWSAGHSSESGTDMVFLQKPYFSEEKRCHNKWCFV